VKKGRGFLLAGTAGMLAFAGSPAFAQTSGAGTVSPNTQKGATLPSVGGPGNQDGIVVSAQKRIENVQAVPKQVVVASQVQLSNAGVTRITRPPRDLRTRPGCDHPRPRSEVCWRKAALECAGGPPAYLKEQHPTLLSQVNCLQN
jgi:pectate lyase